MKNLFLIRHGEYDKETGSLNEKGIKDIKKIADEIIPYVKSDDNLLFMSSHYVRAQESSKIIKENLQKDGEILIHDWLAESMFVPALLSEIDRTKHTNYIVLSHLSFVEDFLKNFAYQNKVKMQINQISPGTGFYFNLENSEYCKIPRL